MTVPDTRTTSFGEQADLTMVDRFGVWLSQRQIRRTVGDLTGRDVADFGCGYDAKTMRHYLGVVRTATLVDLSLAPDLLTVPNVRAIEGPLPDSLAALPDASLDVVMCMSVLEHLWEPQLSLNEFRRLLRPGGVCAVNVPSWLGKRALEYSAFKLGKSPVEEMNDHKTYYDPKDLWPLLVKAGFRPINIRCFRHKFRLNTFALCRVDKESVTT
ncbi:class I SAM-dependent methyltransferase [Dactylosporangium roseum]|uniref:Class I SAM-dependent methyltransferase n=1 Tax=Dactylosporangium roseum TaxID=47989 RepID=A0ABY5ZHU0_9ACTN|nr:class I SAM-dependent methyltransferase [Dactylosporangium roseum]UWZ39824.1 class I SAM-dependent methyltransferase [Dactylosporangium roseum]